ncbi:hypothetical protein A3J02_02305 [Candidatus Azambacteria bacterium RIFCSPLOWO2_02_FULL_46_11]|uniref:Uncharacterized protein n=1 Tax=Candidatus Azambacteria bacterium RIFCSPLOWO2_02_FULL_46_11 TaxID=1797300 RepID=A0A1F5CKN1_9BACT|nr:MAG: hypothetical protein A3J02_02305 [Candidatus Azambacteria bacterium RIFCSPLOWO2_02_FULL_46_11]
MNIFPPGNAFPEKIIVVGLTASPTGGRGTVGAVGAGVTVNVFEPDSPPPGDGVKTVIGKLPAVVRSEDGMVAVSWVELT